MSPIMHPGDIDEGPVAALGLTPGTRVQAILLDEDRTELPGMIGTVVPVSDWPASFPEQWTEENTVIVRWDGEDGRKPFTPYRRDVAVRVLVVLDTPTDTSGGAVTPSSPVPPEAPTQDHGPLAAPLSDRTLAKVLSRPAHVPSLVVLDSAEHLAEEVASLLTRFSENLEIFLPVRAALADYREVTR